MEPQDEHSIEPPFAESEPEGAPVTAPTPEEAIDIDPEVGAALLLSGNYSRSLADHVFSGLSTDEMMRLSQGLIRLKATAEERMERMWNRLTLLFTGDWREEDDLVEFIRVVLRKGVRQEPPLTPVQKLALLLLALPEDVSAQSTNVILGGLNRPSMNDLARELAHLLHYPNQQVHDRVLGEFMAFAQARASRSTRFMSLSWMECEAERVVRRDVVSCADVAQHLWMQEGELSATYHDAAREQPDRLIALLKAFAYSPTHVTYIPPLHRAATFRACLTPEAAGLLDVAMKNEDETLPEPFVSPARKELVLREFLHRYYLEHMKQIPLIMQ